MTDSAASNEVHASPPQMLRACLLAALAGLASCQPEEQAKAPPLEHVRVEAAVVGRDVVRASGTGAIMARVSSDLSFKVSGRVVTRTVDIGDHVQAGQVLATLDPVEQSADIDSAKASVAAAEATLRMTSSVLNRRKTLTESGALSQQELDSALQQYQSAQKDLDASRAALETANDALGQTELRADADGTITARNVEVGQVVQPSTAVFTLAHDGDRDAVFNVQESALSGPAAPLSLDVSLQSRPEIKTSAKLREISPTLDRSLGTVRVKLAIVNPPPQMTLGAAIVANVVLEARERISVPWQSMFSKAGKPAVWTVDPATTTTSLKPVVVERYDASRVVLASGLQPGELVVVDGGQFLREQQKVSMSEEAAR